MNDRRVFDIKTTASAANGCAIRQLENEKKLCKSFESPLVAHGNQRGQARVVHGSLTVTLSTKFLCIRNSVRRNSDDNSIERWNRESSFSRVQLRLCE